MLFDDKGQFKTSPKELADILQKQFISVFSDPSKANWSEATFNKSPIQVPFADEFMEFTIDDIIAAIDKIYQNAASGPDEMPAMLHFSKIAKILSQFPSTSLGPLLG